MKLCGVIVKFAGHFYNCFPSVSEGKNIDVNKRRNQGCVSGALESLSGRIPPFLLAISKKTTLTFSCDFNVTLSPHTVLAPPRFPPVLRARPPQRLS